MAIFKTFTDESATSATDSFQGNVDLSVKGLKGVVLLEVQYPGSARWDRIMGWDSQSTPVDSVLVAGDSTVLYRFRAIGVVGSCEVYLGQV